MNILNGYSQYLALFIRSQYQLDASPHFPKAAENSPDSIRLKSHTPTNQE